MRFATAALVAGILLLAGFLALAPVAGWSDAATTDTPFWPGRLGVVSLLKARAGVRGVLGVTPHEREQVAREVRRVGFGHTVVVGARPCQRCHQEIAAQWAQSAHRFASLSNPFYLASLRVMRRERGV